MRLREIRRLRPTSADLGRPCRTLRLDPGPEERPGKAGGSRPQKIEFLAAQRPLAAAVIQPDKAQQGRACQHGDQDKGFDALLPEDLLQGHRRIRRHDGKG